MRGRPTLTLLVKKSLAGHAWLGLLAGGLLYLICLSGSLAVFYEEFERWEQPNVDEMPATEPALVQQAVATVLQRLEQPPAHLYVGLPTPVAPRLTVATDQEDQAWFVNADGSLGQHVAHDWTHLLLNLHIYLHLPSTLGLLVVGASGALLFGLVVSGFLAHPRIFKDAFRFRVGGSRYLEQLDLHNRLSVWGTPFHVVISLTGAYFGLATVLFTVLGMAFHDGKTDGVVAALYGDEPVVQGVARVPDIATALQRLDDVAPPGARPSALTVHDAGTAKQHLAFEVLYPQRLIWAEYYRFDGDGNYVGRTDYSDGPIGRQVIYSSYRVHFGNFAGWPVKVIYFLLGMSLTVISASGINIWLARRVTRDYLNDLWMGTIWGAPAALALTAVTEVLLDVPSTAVFWLAVVGAVACSLRVQDPARARRLLCAITAGLLYVLVAGYFAKFGIDRLPAVAWWTNAGVIASAIALSVVAVFPMTKAVAAEHASPAVIAAS